MDSLPLSNPPAPGKVRPRICLATTELAGFGPSSGLGSLVSSLAETLAEAGREVTVVLARDQPPEAIELARLVELYSRRGVRVTPLPEPSERCFAWPRSSSRAYKTYRWLREHATEFDRVLFCDRGGLGYYALLAKHQGLAFEQLPLGVAIHSPTLRRTLDNAELVEDYEILIADFLERESARLADGVVATSGALLRALQADGWSFPEACHVLPPPFPASLVALRRQDRETLTPEEIVLFGPLESRKRLRLLCDALERLEPSPHGNLRIVFLGPSGRIESEPGRDYLARRAARWPFAWEWLDRMERTEALGYLGKGKRLAIVSSTAQGVPFSAWECAFLGIPFLYFGARGIAEDLPEAERERLVAANPNALAARIRDAWLRGISVPQPPVDPFAVRDEWARWLEGLSSRDGSDQNPERADLPRVTVCLVHHDRPALLSQALDSLRAQDYPNFEVVLVDDGSATQEAAAFLAQIEPEFAKRDWRIIRQPNLYLGAARNRAAREAKGEFLLFMDDDNLAEPHEISTFVRVARHTGAAILTATQRDFEGKERFGGEGRNHYIFAPLGPSLSLGVVFNVFGDANAFVRRDAFEAIGGFREEHGVAFEDWEFFAKAALAGLQLEVVPEPLFWYRRSAEGMFSTSSHFASWLAATSPYIAHLTPRLAESLLLLQGNFRQTDVLRREGETARRERDRVQTLLDQKEAEVHQKEVELHQKKEELREARDELARIQRSRIWHLGLRLRRWEWKLRSIRKALFRG
ncbi:glycosyltransferase [Methylacidimicrobium sp. B4]|uniref:glycosyltransferase n=1 Tax=Methylacidimicrobium sp. B4 TaxID=2796139 RepID=UPI001A8D311A|nr:glycosyltransferase [Methylacidimicrobium sp. B4]QSR84389.1 glycosyltransferase [Methylacidimicrobium sp. B4]